MTTRRRFIAGTIGLAAAVGLPMARKAEAALMPTDGYPDHIVATDSSSDFVSRVFLDGVDITAECFECHRSQGWARCFVRGEDGQFILDGDDDGWEMHTVSDGEIFETKRSNPLVPRETFLRGKVVVEWGSGPKQSWAEIERQSMIDGVRERSPSVQAAISEMEKNKVVLYCGYTAKQIQTMPENEYRRLYHQPN